MKSKKTSIETLFEVDISTDFAGHGSKKTAHSL